MQVCSAARAQINNHDAPEATISQHVHNHDHNWLTIMVTNHDHNWLTSNISQHACPQAQQWRTGSRTAQNACPLVGCRGPERSLTTLRYLCTSGRTCCICPLRRFCLCGLCLCLILAQGKELLVDRRWRAALHHRQLVGRCRGPLGASAAMSFDVAMQLPAYRARPAAQHHDQ